MSWEKLPSMSVMVPLFSEPTSITEAPMTERPVDFSTTVPFTEICCACNVIPINSATNIVHVLKQMFFIIHNILKLKLYLDTNLSHTASDFLRGKYKTNINILS